MGETECINHSEIETDEKCRILAFKRWLFAMQDMAFYASIHSVLEKRWFVAELGFSPCTIIGSGLLRKECGGGSLF